MNEKNNKLNRNIDESNQTSTLKKWTTPSIKVVTPIKRTAAGFLLKAGVENGIYFSS